MSPGAVAVVVCVPVLVVGVVAVETLGQQPVAVMVGLIVVSSLMRYVVGRPFHFTEELSALFFMALTVMPIAYMAKLKNHIRISIIFDRIPQPARDWVALTAHAATLVFVIVVVKITWDFAYMTHELGGRSPDASLVLFPWMVLIPIFFEDELVGFLKETGGGDGISAEGDGCALPVVRAGGGCPQLG